MLKTEDEGIINFSIKMARTSSWVSAMALAPMNAPQKAAKIAEMDRFVVQLATKIINPGWVMSSALWAIRMGESGNVAQKIKILG